MCCRSPDTSGSNATPIKIINRSGTRNGCSTLACIRTKGKGLNKVYRLVWNRRVSAYAVTSELARGKTRDGRRAVAGVTVMATVAALAITPSVHATVTCTASGCNFGTNGDINTAGVVATGNVSLQTSFSGGNATQAGAITGFGDVTIGSNWYPNPRLIFTGANTYTGTTHVQSWGALQVGTTTQASTMPGDIVFENRLDSGNNYFAGNLYFINATGANGQAYDGVISHPNGFFVSGNTVLGAATVDSSSTVAGHAGGTIEIGGNASTGQARLSGFSQLTYAANSSAGNASIVAPAAPPGPNGSTLIQFLDQSNAGSAHITSGTVDGYTSGVYFGAQASAGTAAMVIGDAAGTAGPNTVNNPGRNTLQFWNQATADHATVENHNGYLLFDYDSTAAQSTIRNDLGGIVDFYDHATAGQATITNGSGSSVTFEADTTGDQATFHNLAGGNLDISQNNASVVALGYVDGAGDIYLGNHTLSLGATAADATIGGVIKDGFGPAFADAGLTATTGGRLLKTGTGRLVLDGDNTYTGGTTIQSGSLQLGDGGTRGSVIGDIVDNGTLVFDRSDTARFDGPFSGAGNVIQAGSGILVWNAVSTGTGATTLQAGQLTVGDATHRTANLGGDLNQVQGTALTGFGRIAGNAHLDGIVAPGDDATIGALRVDGNAVFGSTSQYKVKATPEGASDSVSVGGTATLAGSVLALGQNRDYQPSTTYTILTAAQGIVGQYAAVSSNFAFLDPTIGYRTNAVDLTLVRNSTPLGSVGTTPNQAQTGNAVETLPGVPAGVPVAGASPVDPTGGSVYDAVVVMSVADARKTFTQLSGDLHASLRSTLVDDTRTVRNAMRDRGIELGGSNIDDGLGMWTRTLGGNASYASDPGSGSAGLHASQSGVLTGADATFDEQVRVGVMVGYGYSSIRSATPGANGTIRTQHLGIYGAGRIDDVLLSGGAGYGWNEVRTTRRITVPGIEQSLFGDYHVPTAHAFAEAGWRLPMNRFTAEPFVNAAVVRTQSDGFHERGGDAALQASSRTQTTPISTTGLRGDWDLSPADATPATTAVRASVAWQHAYGSVAPRRALNFIAGGDAFDIQGAPIARDAAVASVGVNLRMGARTSLSLNLDGMFAHGTRRSAATANVKVDL